MSSIQAFETSIIPLFDPKEEQRLEKQHDLWINKQKLLLFPEISEPEPPSPNGNSFPQDACGGHQWSARRERWVK